MTAPQYTFDEESGHPIDVMARYPEKSSRGLALLAILFFLKIILLVPHLIVLWALSIAVGVVMFIGYWAVLFTGRYPRGLWDFGVGFLRWTVRVQAWAMGLTDKYPPFTLNS